MLLKLVEIIINMGGKAPQTDWGTVIVILAFFLLIAFLLWLGFRDK